MVAHLLFQEQFIGINKMSKIIESKITRFDGGMTNDPRDMGVGYSQLCKNFDNFTKPNSLLPTRSSEQITDIAGIAQSLAQIKRFLMYGGNLYGLGVIGDGTTKCQVYRCAAADLTSPVFVAQTNALDSSAGDNSGLFVEYKGTLWGDAGGTRLWSHVLATNTFTTSAQAVTYTSITQAMIHSKDDKLYFGYTNTNGTFIASKNGADAWNLTALTLPTKLSVASISEYGNFLAIACKPVQVGDN